METVLRMNDARPNYLAAPTSIPDDAAGVRPNAWAGEALLLRHGSKRTVLNRAANFVKRLHEMEGLCFKGRVFMFEGKRGPQGVNMTALAAASRQRARSNKSTPMEARTAMLSGPPNPGVHKQCTRKSVLQGQHRHGKFARLARQLYRIGEDHNLRLK